MESEAEPADTAQWTLQPDQQRGATARRAAGHDWWRGMFQPGTDVALLLAVSTWTSVMCVAAARYAARGPRLRDTGPRWSMLLLLAVGSVVWGANALVQPMTALQVAGASVAVRFAWEVAGVLEYFVRTRF